jgi:hypothetical protein
VRRAGRLGLIFTTHPVSSTSPRSSSIAVISGVLSACPCPLALARDRHLSGSAADALPQAAHQRGSVRSAALAPADRRARTRHRLTRERGIAGRALREKHCARTCAAHALNAPSRTMQSLPLTRRSTVGGHRPCAQGDSGGVARKGARGARSAPSLPPVGGLIQHPPPP